MAWGRIGIVTTILAWVSYVISTIMRQLADNPDAGFRFRFEAAMYLAVVTFLTFSALMYLVARQGALLRFSQHRRVPRGELDRHFRTYEKSITTLVPSYAEEPSVVRQTLWSVALQEFTNLHVVLLVDDNPYPQDPEVLAKLQETRDLATNIQLELEPALNAAHSSHTLLTRQREAGASSAQMLATTIEAYDAAATWLEDMAANEKVEDHVDEFFVDSVIMGLARELRLTLLALKAAAAQNDSPGSDRLEEFHLRLERIFSVQMHSFERKKYANLSQEVNKAMNLNAYISLMGQKWLVEQRGDIEVLRALDPAQEIPETGQVLAIPDSEYLLTLDADSLLLRDYCLRLVYFLESEENSRVAVTQTPYSSFRGAPTRIERLAGATTDIQHILHQGKTRYNATFWVGANAVIRKQALLDICQTATVGGYEIQTYIQDRTVIEDTESSIDLGTYGWTLSNYPERLSYSATPPDFGSLVVQRRRWANGGLLILPKFGRQISDRKRRNERIGLREVLLRVNYMASIAWASVGLIFLLAYPYDGRLLSPLIFAAALPYFIAMGSDLRDSGHRFSDIFRIYGFNLILLPVNMAGVLKSTEQAFTGEKIPFVRTPKVRNRTASPGLYVAIPYLIVIFSLFTMWRDFQDSNWGNVAFAALNSVLALYAIRAYIGFKNSIVDMALGLVNWLFVSPKKVKKAAMAYPVATPENTDWSTLLYQGDRRLDRDLRGNDDRRKRIGVK
ncbi:glycosyltransferase family 2 protein [Paeniglutamicibacter terrestris]|uniref:Glycosyltransferase n=1 Tax=Paeniglutamicibacter terrestris TaxID=2723403 RepID=A0ABX1FZR6_9MICC|nr:glycosyltransferase family 2 protein [Paeniglutamicibacter terrestris]ASN38342.1 glycosyltransferase [Arthrobacter sp. 7749]NKG19428.1 glycosyltransferase [Paeniglutamicibacter terrestris]